MHERDVGVGRREALVGDLAFDGPAHRVDHPRREISGQARLELDQDERKGGADELAPVGIVVLPNLRVGGRRSASSGARR
jgi:hypothetical protein